MEEKTKKTEQPSNKKVVGTVVTFAIVAVAAVVLIYALLNIFGIFDSYKKDAELYGELRAYAEAPQVDESGLPTGNRNIDFDALRAINPDVVAWITIPDTEIDYPVLSTTDNEFYISHGMDRKEHKSGAIFIDANNLPDFSDQNTVIYGHNMKDGSMFAALHSYEKQEFLDTHPYVFLYTPDGTEHVYQIFAAHDTHESGDTYILRFAGAPQFLEYIRTMQGLSPVKTDTEITATDDIITLSTCILGQETQRYVLQAVKRS